MRIGRILLIVGVLLLVGAVAVAAYFWSRGGLVPATPTPSEPETGTPTPPPPPPMVRIVVAAQNIPRGHMIVEGDNAVVMQDWPEGQVPDGAITRLEDAHDRIARVDVVMDMPILEDMLTEEALGIGAAGSDAALQIPVGKVGYAIPAARYSSAAWALRPGDRVDVILSLLMVDLDEEFQTILPNKATCQTGAEEGCAIDVYGRLEVLPTGALVNVTPSEAQRPRLVTQLTVQDALVLQVGDWPRPEDLLPPPEEAVAIEEEPAQEEPPPPPPPIPEVQPLTLAVTQQDAMVLEFAQAVGARFTFVLRAVDDTQAVATESVTLEYLLARFDIELPSKLPYGATPPLLRLVPIARNETVGQY